MADDFELVDDVYQYRSTIYRGNQTRVDEVIEQGTGRLFAMKIVIEGTPNAKEAKINLKKEAAVLKQMEHPNIIRFEKFSTSHDATYILMEFFRAANVKSQLKAELSDLQSRARQLMENVCQALAYIHDKGWVHRDLKPDNMLLNRAGEMRLLDFSLATRVTQGFAKMIGMGRQQSIQGTRTYIAPETIRKQAPNAQTDIYSLGITFFEILTGRTPFQGSTPDELLQKHLKAEPPNPSEFNPNVTPEMDRVISFMLRKKAKDRPGSVDEVRAEISRIKIFKEDVVLLKAASVQRAEEEKMSLIAKLDSRMDAQRTEKLQADPSLAEQFEAERQAREARRKSKHKPRLGDLKTGTGGAAKGKPAASTPVPVPPPLQPVMAPPMMSVPMMPVYGQPPMMYPGYAPGMMQPTYPSMPLMPTVPSVASMPVIPTIPYDIPPAAPPRPPVAPPPAPPAAQRQPPKPPAAPQPSAPARPPAAAPPPAPTPQPPADLDYMTELPDVV